ncbi:MAG: TonB-dependent receptor [Bacteroidota bacterium]
MKKFCLIFSLLVSSFSLFAQDGTLTGKVMDSEGEPLIGANVQVVGTTMGTVSDLDGKYDLSLTPGDYTISFSYTGFGEITESVTIRSGQTTSFDATMEEGTFFDAVVVSGSKKAEKLTESPATIETILAEEIENYAGNPGELLARQKGVDYFRAGVVGVGINIRGYNNNFNSKNLQVTDGRFSALIATGLPYGPLNTTVKEDIERVEVILGPNSTLYGPNAHNGLLNIITKDPRRHEGTTIALTGGNQSQLSARFRHAQVLSDKFAFKVVGEYTKGDEFAWTDSVYIGGEGFPEIFANPEFSFFRTEASAIYSPDKKTDITFNWGRSNSTYLSPTNVGRNSIKDWRINYYQLKFTTDNFFAQVVYDQSRTDSTYAIDNRTKAYFGGLAAGLSESEALANSFPKGTLFTDDSDRITGEAQYYNTFGNLDFIVGAQYRLDRANSRTTYLLDNGESINQTQVGAYLHLTYEMGNGWKGLAAARADNHEIYGFNLVPKLGILKIGDIGTWRLTYGRGIAAPTIFNLEADVFSGLLLGNGEGFTLADGSVVDVQRVEKLQTFELGYRGQLVKNKLFFDANAYYNISEDFLSPLTVIGVASLRGDTPIEQVQSGFGVWNGLVATYVNFGQFNTYGFDMGINYYFNDKWSTNLNYSYFGYSIDENNLDNDFDRNGVVNFLDLLPNAPNNKGGIGLNYKGDKLYGTVYVRMVEAFDYFSGFQVASRTYPDLTWRGAPIVENARGADAFNYGPLGGFTTVDVNLGYRINDIFTVGLAVSNLFDTTLREFTAAPPTRRLIGVDLRANLPAIKRN